MQVSLVPVKPEDKPFLFSVYASTRAGEMAMIGWNADFQDSFLRSQYEAQQRYYQSQFPRAEHSVVYGDSLPVGQMIVNRTQQEIHLVDISILPQFRGNGIATQLLHSLMEEAWREEQFVRLQVDQSNPALHWYRRLGFVATSRQGFYCEMVWKSSVLESAGNVAVIAKNISIPAADL